MIVIIIPAVHRQREIRELSRRFNDIRVCFCPRTAGKPIRRLWGTRVKKMDGRWMVSVLEVETLGSRHRTKITVDALRDL